MINQMKIGILSVNPHLYSNQRLIEAFQNRGHLTKIINYTESFYKLGDTSNEFDIIIPRSWHKIIYEFFVNLNSHTNSKLYVLNTMPSILLSKNRIFTLQKLAQNGIAIPTTLVGSILNKNNYEDFKTLFQSNSFLVKPIYGSQGRDIKLIQNRVEWDGLKLQLNFEYYFQEFIQESRGVDLRVLVLGKNIIGGMIRKNKTHFLSNIHQGGIGEKVDLTKEEKDLALNVASILKLDFVGVDILRSNRGPLVIDINSTPGFEGLDKALKIDTAGLIADYTLKIIQ
ncbi:MAG: RimK family alpha-L-glutamate ligase [Bacteriovoracaceae bacterium]